MSATDGPVEAFSVPLPVPEVLPLEPGKPALAPAPAEPPQAPDAPQPSGAPSKR